MRRVVLELEDDEVDTLVDAVDECLDALEDYVKHGDDCAERLDATRRLMVKVYNATK